MSQENTAADISAAEPGQNVSYRSPSPTRAAWRRFRANRTAVVGSLAILAMAGLSVVGLVLGHTRVYVDATDTVGRPRYVAQDKERARSAPERAVGWCRAHPLGTNAEGKPCYWLGGDDIGRDYLVRVLYGGVVSLGIGISAALVAAIFGTLYGLVAGYAGGWIDDLMMRLAEVLYSLPYMLLVILTFLLINAAFVATANWLIAREIVWFGELLTNAGIRSILGMFVSVAAFNWMTTARVVRGQVLQLREMPYVEAARALGAPGWRILMSHLLPNLLGPVIVMATLMVPQAILLESFLSFLGLGIQAPEATWGVLAAEAVKSINPVENRYHVLVPPCLGLALTLLSLNFVGDGLRDALDPHGRR